MRLVYEHLTAIPANFTEVEYLESSGTQYIDTGFKMEDGKTMTFEGNMMWKSSNGNANFFYGYRSVNSAEYRGDMRAFFVYGDSAPPAGRLAIRYGVNTDNSTSTILKNTIYKISFDGTNLKVNDTTFIWLSQAYTPANYKNMWLFNCNCTGYYSADVSRFSGRIYYWKILSGGVLVRDFVPCLDNNNTPCLYDKVEGKAYYNQGTGTLTAGRQVIPVNYLESTGTQYIDTGYKFTSNMRFKINHIPTGSISDNYFTGHYATDNKVFLGGFYQNKCIWGIGKLQENTINASANQRFVVDMTYTSNSSTNTSSVSGTINGQSVSLNSTALQNFVYGLNILAFARNNNGSVGHYLSCKLYSFQIYNSDTLVRDFVPCKDENNVGFMFDRVTHTAHLNAGTGSFAFGKVMPKKKLRLIRDSKRRLPKGFKEVEYLQSSGTQYINTGYIPNQNTYVEMNAMYTALDSTYRTPFSVRAYDGATNSFTIAGATNSANVYAFGSQYWSGDNGCPIAYTNVKYFMSLKAGVAIFNGVTGNAGTTITPTTLTAYMFARNANGTASNFFKGRIYYCKIFENGVLLRSFIPCLDSNNVPCMYDKIEGKAYYNEGTGSFSYGHTITPVEYLEGTGTQYIDLNYIPKDTSGMRVVWSYANNNDVVIAGSRKSIGSDNRWFIGHYSLGLYFGWNTLISTTETSIDTFYDCTLNLYNDRKAYINGEEKATISTTLTTTDMAQTKLFWVINATNKAVGKLKLCQITEGNNLIYDFIPVKDENNVGYMFDKVNHSLYANAGTGTFVVGNQIKQSIVRFVTDDVPNIYRRASYLQSSGTQYIDTEVIPSETVSYGWEIYAQAVDTGENDYHWFIGTQTPWQMAGTYPDGSQYTFYPGGGDYYQEGSRVSLPSGGNKYAFVQHINSYTGSSSNSTSITLFARRASNGGVSTNGSKKIFGCKMYKNNVLIRDFVPVVRKSDNKPGMYDRVTKQFFTNAGTGEFTYE